MGKVTRYNQEGRESGRKKVGNEGKFEEGGDGEIQKAGGTGGRHGGHSELK